MPLAVGGGGLAVSVFIDVFSLSWLDTSMQTLEGNGGLGVQDSFWEEEDNESRL